MPTTTWITLTTSVPEGKIMDRRKTPIATDLGEKSIVIRAAQNKQNQKLVGVQAKSTYINDLRKLQTKIAGTQSSNYMLRFKSSTANDEIKVHVHAGISSARSLFLARNFAETNVVEVLTSNLHLHKVILEYIYTGMATEVPDEEEFYRLLHELEMDYHPLSMIYSDIGKMFNNLTYFSDVTLVYPDGKIHCHRDILCQRSEYFSAMFHSGMMESDQSEIIMEEPEMYKPMLVIIKYFYTDSLDTTWCENGIEL
jgi:hypothetical protein